MNILCLTIITSFAFLTACDPASLSARVRPDKTADIEVASSKNLIPADIYLSGDKKIELQIFSSGPTLGVGAPGIDAVIVNNRQEPIEIDLSLATYQPKWSEKPIPVTKSWFEGCETEQQSSSFCKAKFFVLPPGQSKHVSWKNGAEGDFRLPIMSKSEKADVIVAKFKRCNPLWGKCETEK